MGRLFWKFFFSIMLAQVAATVGIGGAFWLRDRAREREATPAIDTSPPAKFLVDGAAATLTHGGAKALRDQVAALRERSIYVVDETGHEALGRPVAHELITQAEQRLLRDETPQVVRSIVAQDGHRYLIFAPWDQRHRPGGPPRKPNDADHPGARGEPPPPGEPGGGPSRRPPMDRAYVPVAPLIAGTFASLLVAALLAWYFARPIRALRSAFEAAAAGDLAPRFTDAAHARGDELTNLGRDFDRMSAQLRALMEGQRRLLHDVSHELRSPLARLQAAIGLAHQSPDKLDASLERIERESVRMDKLVGELLTLSRLEAAAPFPMDEEIDLAELVGEIADDARFEAEQSGRRITMTGTTRCTVHGAPDLLWRAIENVVRNAIKHGFDDGTVEIELSAQDGAARVSINDRGPGVSENDLSAIFKPFYRANNGNGNVDGHGLGLAIAERVILAHGGTIAATNRDGGGLGVTITLPCRSEAPA